MDKTHTHTTRDHRKCQAKNNMLTGLGFTFSEKTTCMSERRAFVGIQRGLYKGFGNSGKFLVLCYSSSERRWKNSS